MLRDLKDITFHAPPTMWKNPAAGVYWIAGISPMEVHTPERFEELKREFVRRQDEAREARAQLREKTWEVPSNKDPQKTYTVTQSITGSWDCTCQGFKFRHRCSHVDKVQEEEK